MAELASKFNIACVIQYYSDQWVWCYFQRKLQVGKDIRAQLFVDFEYLPCVCI